MPACHVGYIGNEDALARLLAGKGADDAPRVAVDEVGDGHFGGVYEDQVVHRGLYVVYAAT